MSFENPNILPVEEAPEKGAEKKETERNFYQEIDSLPEDFEKVIYIEGTPFKVERISDKEGEFARSGFLISSVHESAEIPIGGGMLRESDWANPEFVGNNQEAVNSFFKNAVEGLEK